MRRAAGARPSCSRAPTSRGAVRGGVLRFEGAELLKRVDARVFLFAREGSCCQAACTVGWLVGWLVVQCGGWRCWSRGLGHAVCMLAACPIAIHRHPAAASANETAAAPLTTTAAEPLPPPPPPSRRPPPTVRPEGQSRSSPAVSSRSCRCVKLSRRRLTRSPARRDTNCAQRGRGGERGACGGRGEEEESARGRMRTLFVLRRACRRARGGGGGAALEPFVACRAPARAAPEAAHPAAAGVDVDPRLCRQRRVAALEQRDALARRQRDERRVAGRGRDAGAGADAQRLVGGALLQRAGRVVLF